MTDHTDDAIDGNIRAGDVVHDLVKRGKMVVVERAAGSVREYRDREDFDLATYKAHPLLDVGDDEAVWTCVYLPDEPTTSFSGTYDFPASRLARIPIEEANEDLDRVQDDLIVSLLETMLAAGGDDVDVVEAVARDAGIPGELVDQARELVDVEQTIGGEA